MGINIPSFVNKLLPAKLKKNTIKTAFVLLLTFVSPNFSNAQNNGYLNIWNGKKIEQKDWFKKRSSGLLLNTLSFDDCLNKNWDWLEWWNNIFDLINTVNEKNIKEVYNKVDNFAWENTCVECYLYLEKKLSELSIQTSEIIQYRIYCLLRANSINKDKWKDIVDIINNLNEILTLLSQLNFDEIGDSFISDFLPNLLDQLKYVILSGKQILNLDDLIESLNYLIDSKKLDLKIINNIMNFLNAYYQINNYYPISGFDKLIWSWWKYFDNDKNIGSDIFSLVFDWFKNNSYDKDKNNSNFVFGINYAIYLYNKWDLSNSKDLFKVIEKAWYNSLELNYYLAIIYLSEWNINLFIEYFWKFLKATSNFEDIAFQFDLHELIKSFFDFYSQNPNFFEKVLNEYHLRQSVKNTTNQLDDDLQIRQIVDDLNNYLLIWVIFVIILFLFISTFGFALYKTKQKKKLEEQKKQLEELNKQLQELIKILNELNEMIFVVDAHWEILEEKSWWFKTDNAWQFFEEKNKTSLIWDTTSDLKNLTYNIKNKNWEKVDIKSIEEEIRDENWKISLKKLLKYLSKDDIQNGSTVMFEYKLENKVYNVLIQKIDNNRFFVVDHDITEIKKAQEELKETLKELEKAIWTWKWIINFIFPSVNLLKEKLKNINLSGEIKPRWSVWWDFFMYRLSKTKILLLLWDSFWHSLQWAFTSILWYSIISEILNIHFDSLYIKDNNSIYEIINFMMNKYITRFINGEVNNDQTWFKQIWSALNFVYLSLNKEEKEINNSKVEYRQLATCISKDSHWYLAFTKEQFEDFRNLNNFSVEFDENNKKYLCFWGLYIKFVEKEDFYFIQLNRLYKKGKKEEIWKNTEKKDVFVPAFEEDTKWNNMFKVYYYDNNWNKYNWNNWNNWNDDSVKYTIACLKVPVWAKVLQFSDGLPDQFWGKSIKKLKTSNLLRYIAKQLKKNESLDNIIKKTFSFVEERQKDWKKEEQTDDQSFIITEV